MPILDQASNIVGKRVFLRGDLDVPLSQLTTNNGQQTTIADDTRLKNVWPTIELLLQQSCQVILGGHLGRTEGKTDPNFSSKPVAQWFLDKLRKTSIFNSQFSICNEIQNESINNLQAFKISENLIILENLRFDLREETNDPEFARQLASLADVYVNESFANCERAHTSMVGVPKLLPHYAGFRLAKEVEVLSKLIESPKRPMVVIIGGAKLETKLPVISRMAAVADFVIVGGKLLTEILVGSEIMKLPNVKLLRLTENGKDTTLSSIDNLQMTIKNSGTIVWNGPVGQVEDYTYQVGSRRIAELVTASGAEKILGGGDTIGLVNKLGLIEKFDWVSSGGGSMLKFLAGEKLPGIEALLY